MPYRCFKSKGSYAWAAIHDAELEDTICIGHLEQDRESTVVIMLHESAYVGVQHHKLELDIICFVGYPSSLLRIIFLNGEGIDDIILKARERRQGTQSVLFFSVILQIRHSVRKGHTHTLTLIR